MTNMGCYDIMPASGSLTKKTNKEHLMRNPRYSTTISYHDEACARSTIHSLGIVQGTYHVDLRVVVGGSGPNDADAIDEIERFAVTLVDDDGLDALKIDVLKSAIGDRRINEWISCFFLKDGDNLQDEIFRRAFEVDLEV